MVDMGDNAEITGRIRGRHGQSVNIVEPSRRVNPVGASLFKGGGKGVLKALTIQGFKTRWDA
jgi:hypothetical protein